VRNDAGDDVEISLPLTTAIDLAEIKTGWILFQDGDPPDTAWDKGQIVGPRPSPKHKRGFAVNLYAKDFGLREFSSTSNGSIAAITELYDKFEAAPQSAEKLIPIVRWESVTAVKGKFGTNYEPMLKIVNWRPRPPEMPATGLPEPAARRDKEPVQSIEQLRTATRAQLDRSSDAVDDTGRRPLKRRVSTSEELDDEMPF
jgi:hypothetical protein